MRVFDWRWAEVGVVADLWIDQSIKILRLLEVELHDGLAPPGTPWSRRVLVPIFHADIRERERVVHVTALRAHQFADLPMPASTDVITAREEDRSTPTTPPAASTAIPRATEPPNPRAHPAPFGRVLMRDLP